MYSFGTHNEVPAQIFLPKENPRSIMFRVTKIGKISLAFQVVCKTSTLEKALDRFGSWELAKKGETFKILGQDPG